MPEPLSIPTQAPGAPQEEAKPGLPPWIRANGNVDPVKLAEAYHVSQESGETLDRVLTSRGYLTEKDMLRLFSGLLGLTYLETLEGVQVPEEFSSKVPVSVSRNHNLVAIGREGDAWKIATCYPLDAFPMDEIARMLGGEAIPVLASKGDITSTINRAYQQKVDVVNEMIDGLKIDDLQAAERVVDESHDLLDLANQAPVIRLVNMFIFQALKMRASDVHIQPYEEKLQIRYRIDGVLYDMMTPPKKIQDAILSRVKVMGKMDIAERRLPQDGRATLKIGDGEVDVRISSVPTQHGERIVMRLLDKSARVLALEEMGLDPEQMKAMQTFIDCAHGIVLVTGPTGSGKSTTLYAVLKRINSQEYNVITIEDPVEYHLPGVSQIEVSNKKGLTFAAGLRSIVRQDPDIIMVGEIRDKETAAIAIQSALTGHLVFSTLHTNDAPTAAMRLLDLGVEPYLVSSSLIGVVAQRLVRVICKNCKVVHNPTSEELESIGLSLKEAEGHTIYRGTGCPQCFKTGYMDRTGIYEILPVNDHVRDQILGKVGANTIKQDAVKAGLRTLRMDGAKKVLKGVTTIEEVLRVTQMDVV